MLSGINQASQMASQLFSRLDTKSQALSKRATWHRPSARFRANRVKAAPASMTCSSCFSDSNSDGKVTKDEFASVLAQLQEQMDSQRMRGGAQGAGGMPPCRRPATMLALPRTN